MKYSKRRAKKLARQLKLDGYQDYRALAKGLRLSKIGGSVIATITALGLLSSLSVVFGVLAIVGGIVA
ncbi:MAG TPA: hypothetical protein VLF67_01650, partial [Candidatus Saccharimonas sp.]|nr:hypothetical protein [Candidatus Saccharimonas sp.]